jgi:hypothetical protein
MRATSHPWVVSAGACQSRREPRRFARCPLPVARKLLLTKLLDVEFSWDWDHANGCFFLLDPIMRWRLVRFALLHSEAADLNTPLPTPDVVDAEIVAVENG